MEELYKNWYKGRFSLVLKHKTTPFYQIIHGFESKEDALKRAENYLDQYNYKIRKTTRKDFNEKMKQEAIESEKGLQKLFGHLTK